MNKLEDYIKVYRWLDADFCEQIRSELNETTEWKQHVFYNAATGTYGDQSGNRELDVSWAEIPSREKLTKEVWKAVEQYILKDFKKPYFDGWNGFTNIRFNRYHPDRLMALHCDHIHDMFDGQRKGIPTLTILGLLNSDFKGGEFLMFDEEKEIKLSQGDIMIFPSVFLYPHKVAPVTEGIRDAFVSWVW